MEPKVEFNNLELAQSQIHFDLDHVKAFEGLSLSSLYPQVRTRIYNETKQLLVIKSYTKTNYGRKHNICKER